MNCLPTILHRSVPDTPDPQPRVVELEEPELEEPEQPAKMEQPEYPQSVQEAKEHIRQIRRDKGLGDGPDEIGNNAADLEGALKV